MPAAKGMTRTGESRAGPCSPFSAWILFAWPPSFCLGFLVSTALVSSPVALCLTVGLQPLRVTKSQWQELEGQPQSGEKVMTTAPSLSLSPL